MAHYAFINDDNVVTQVIVGTDENEPIEGFDSWEDYYASLFGQRCLRTSYNGNIRKHYAGVGMIYDEQRDAFIIPQPFSSWTLDEQTCVWQSPIPRPNDGLPYYWDEEQQAWIQVEN